MGNARVGFEPRNYFDLSLFPYEDIFDGINNVWEVLQHINPYTNCRLIKGKNCLIAKTALIREGVILGDNVTIGHCVELKHCIVMSNTAVAHLNYIGDGIVGNNVNISGGAVLANFRLDKRSVAVATDNGKIHTNLTKFSAIIGDNCNIGVNAVINPGAILGKGSIVYPLMSVIGVHKRGSVVKK